MRILVFGAGAIGCHLTARLIKAGADVHLIARGQQLDAITDRGLRLIGPQEDFTVPVRAYPSTAGLGQFDLVITAVKAYSLPHIVNDLLPVLGAHTQVASAVNGVPWWYFAGQKGVFGNQPVKRVDPGGGLFHRVGADRALGCVVLSANELVAPGVVQNRSSSNSFVLGPALEGLAVPAQASQLAHWLPSVTVSEHIRAAVWHKLLLNMGSSLLGCLTHSTGSQVAQSPALLGVFEAVMSEGSRVAAAVGVQVPPDLESRLARMRSNHHRCSMLQDLEAGRPLELDSQLLAVQDIARAYGVSTTTIDTLVALLQFKAAAETN
ncbi:2-dehydropantoate 2-reductase [Lampropedia puyangensis]|uniref:2-dehydropantoate 2-reductase n=1 Tax=Lampropedia puyangensis TaxID=1330072 RepID=A0A4V4GQF7_9BURK|nr:2-dehydropantoate 2-reductase [Lampropedia puyangensis]THT98105.1 2-dehydropantoate 2-reductase [Lampropedia puyangensis]